MNKLIIGVALFVLIVSLLVAFIEYRSSQTKPLPATRSISLTQSTPPDSKLLTLENDVSTIFPNDSKNNIVTTLSQAYSEQNPALKYQDFKNAYQQAATLYASLKDARYRVIANDIYLYAKNLPGYKPGDLTLLK